MRAPNNKRARGRTNRRPPNPNRSFESNGPDGKIRGNANQVYDKYSQLARDAAATGDLVAAEGFWQHAEHYYRIMMAMQQNNRPQNQQSGDGQDQNDQNDRSGNDQNDRSGGDDRDDRDQDDQGQTESRSRRGGRNDRSGGDDRDQDDQAQTEPRGDSNESADESGESETAGLERAVRRTRARRPRRARDEDEQGGKSADDGGRATATEDAAD